MDCGSEITAISYRLCKSLQLRIIQNSSILLNHADGTFTSVGRAHIKLTIGKQTHAVIVHVLKRLKYDFLIGLDIGGDIFNLHVAMRDRVVYHPQKPHLTTSKLINTSSLCLHIQDNKQARIHQLVQKYQSCFSQSATNLGRITIEVHRIRTVEYPPISQRPYRQSIANNHETRRQVRDLLAEGLIRESTSPWSFPVTLVPKKDGSKRLCIDYRKLNIITIDDKQPLPHILQVVDHLHNAKYFSTLDIASGYWHVAMHPDDIEKTAFVTDDGHFEWLVMPFGLKNAPSTFQRVVQKVLGNLLWHGCINYLDDIIIYSTTFEEHLSLLEEVFTRLRTANVKLKISKCHFAKQEVEYLGHIIGYNTIMPHPNKLKAVQEFPQPQSVQQLQRFLGLTGWYRRFIPNYSRHAYPLTQLLKKKQSFIWSDAQQNSFNTLKEKLTSRPVLAIFNPSNPCELHTDACKIGIGAILSQKDENGHDHVIAYYSRKLNPHEQNYHTSEQECLAVVDAIEHFHVYLQGVSFTVISDHAALQWLFNFSKPTGRLYRWSVKLSSYSFKVIHRKGVNHKHADALSRAPLIASIEISEIKLAQTSEPIPTYKGLLIRNGIIGIKKNGLYRIILPSSLQQRVLHHYHNGHGHPGINKTSKLINQFYWWKDSFNDIREFVNNCDTCKRVKTFSHLPYGKLQPLETPKEPFDRIGMDTIVMGTAASNTKAKYIQVIVDHHSRYLWAFPTPTNTTASVVNILTNLFRIVGVPKVLLTDRGTNFTSNHFKRFLSQNGVKHIKTSSYHPQTNGLVEKTNNTLITRLKCALKDKPKLKWSTLIPEVVQQYNDTPHDNTGFTPRFLMFGTYSSPTNDPPPVSLEEARKLAFKRTENAKAKSKELYDTKHQAVEFEVNQLVYRLIPQNHPSRNKLTDKRDGPYPVLRKISNLNYEIVKDGVSSSNPSIVHVSQLSAFPLRTQPPQDGKNVTI